LAAALLDDLADVLLAGVNSVRKRNAVRAGKALQRARETQLTLDELSDAAQEGLDVLQVSPFRRRYRTGVQDIRSIAEPLDRAARGVRAVLRRVVTVTENGETVPTALIGLMEQLSSACVLLAADVAAERSLGNAVDALVAVAQDSATVTRSSLSGDMILAQVQTIVVDLLQIAGLDIDEALARSRPREQPRLDEAQPD
jgi:uncharacterized membrane protein YgaE (UPF0421/DUF939 family)